MEQSENANLSLIAALQAKIATLSLENQQLAQIIKVTHCKKKSHLKAEMLIFFFFVKNKKKNVKLIFKNIYLFSPSRNVQLLKERKAMEIPVQTASNPMPRTTPPVLILSSPVTCTSTPVMKRIFWKCLVWTLAVPQSNMRWRRM